MKREEEEMEKRVSIMMFIMREFKPQTSLLETPRSASYPKDHWQLKVCIEFILQWPTLTGEWPIS